MTRDPTPPSWGIQEVLIRMMTPMRREFSRNLDVQNFLHDPAYADAILEQAAASTDELLKSYAQHVKALRETPENKEDLASQNGALDAGAIGDDDTTAEKRKARAIDRVLGKYTRGLR